MRILYLTHLFSDIAGGGEYVFWLYSKYIAKRGHDVYVISLAGNPKSAKKADSRITVFELMPNFKHSGILPQNISINTRYIVKGLQIINEIKKDIDVIHSNVYIPAFLGGIAKTLHRIPHVITLHDLGIVMGMRFLQQWFKEGGSGPLSAFLKTLIGASYELALVKTIPRDAILVPSEETLCDIAKIAEINNVYVIPHFLDEEYYSIYKDKLEIRYEPCILYIGRLTFYKNVHKIIFVFKEVVHHNKNANLVIIGKGPLENILINWIKNRGLQNNIKLLGAATQEEKMAYLAKCTATINLSIFEGFGLTTLESWYFKKPPIVGNMPPLSQVVQHGVDGFVVDPRNYNKVAELILWLLDNEKVAKNIGERGFSKLLENYSPYKVVTQLEKIYNKIINL